jgi:hypothetical protein
MYKICVSLMFLTIFTAATASAQIRVRYDDGPRAATVGESHAYGLSSVIDSRSRANLTNSEAALNLTEVRSRQLDNQLKTANTYFEMRATNRAYRFGTPEDKAAHRAANQERYFRYSQQGRPKRPNSQQLDPVTGEIRWPFSLMKDQYAAQRDAMQKMFAQRAKKGGYITYDEYNSIKATSDQLLASLKADIKNLSGNEYSEGKNFVNALVYEARHGNT